MRERVVRAWWTVLSPFVWAANRLGLCSYKWVNVCCGARRPDLFDALWHQRFYGTPIRALPSDVNLCGIRYRAAASEGIVTFFEDFTKQRITFERDSIAGEPLWYLALSRQPVSASHVRAAYEWTCAVFGGSFEVRRETAPVEGA